MTRPLVTPAGLGRYGNEAGWGPTSLWGQHWGDASITVWHEQVLDHDPCHDDIRSFLGSLKSELDNRGLEVKGITTDGSPLYPKPLQELWPAATHQRSNSTRGIVVIGKSVNFPTIDIRRIK